MANHESSPEDEYFAREEIEKQHKLAHDLNSRRARAEVEALRALHHMKCPSCGNDLANIKIRAVEVARCFYCHGTFLPEGALEKLAHSHDVAPHRIIDALVNVFKRPGKD